MQVPYRGKFFDNSKMPVTEKAQTRNWRNNLTLPHQGWGLSLRLLPRISLLIVEQGFQYSPRKHSLHELCLSTSRDIDTSS